MKISQNGKYGILLALYLSRSGRAQLEDIADTLALDLYTLTEVADKMVQSKVVNFELYNGYELTEDAKFIDVFTAVDNIEFLKKHEYFSKVDKNMEHRALAVYSVNLGLALTPLLNRKIKSAMLELIANEMKALDRANDDDDGTVH